MTNVNRERLFFLLKRYFPFYCFCIQFTVSSTVQREVAELFLLKFSVGLVCSSPDIVSYLKWYLLGLN